AEPLSHTYCKAVENGVTDSTGNEDVAKSREQSHSIQVDEPREMDAFRMREVEIQREVFSNLLLELNVGCVDSGIRIVFAEHADRRECRKTTQRWNIHDARPRWQALTVAAPKGRSACDTKLLHAIVCDRTNLRQHVLPAVENTRTRTNHRF